LADKIAAKLVGAVPEAPHQRGDILVAGVARAAAVTPAHPVDASELGEIGAQERPVPFAALIQLLALHETVNGRGAVEDVANVRRAAAPLVRVIAQPMGRVLEIAREHADVLLPLGAA